MALPTLNWKRLAPVAIGAANVNSMMDALFTAGTAATYADGSARTPGSGSAWTWAVDNTNALQPGATTAAYASPPTVTALNQRIIWGGSTAIPASAPMYSGVQVDTAVANALYCSVAKNTGAYSNWNSATPFTSGQFLGFARAGVLMATATWTTMTMWECQEAVAVQWSRVAPNVQTSINVCGAFLDPGATANGESDGRLYGIASTGNNNYAAATFWSAANDALFQDNGVANHNRFGMFVPGSATTERYLRFVSTAPTAAFLSRDGDIPLIPWWATNANGQAPAVLREIRLCRDTLSNRTLQNGGVVKGYTLGANYITTDADTCVLLA
jgi:hypothetical protein